MHRWKLSALAAAAFVSAALTPTDASALALGRIAVQSALGEPLRAEIDVPQATPAELEALQAGIATPDIFKAQGMEYSSAARQIRVEVVRLPDGTAKLQLSTAGPVNDPFVDLVVDANWSAGHLVRSYTLLLDPPAAKRPAPAITAAPQISPPARAAATPAAQGRTYTSEGATPVATRPPATRPPAPAENGGNSVTVRSGDTAGRIAGANRLSGVSLDQMLVAMQRANPNAFINGNVNRLRTGSVVQIPSREQAQSTPAKEARQIMEAQSRDFNEFRRRVAGKVPDAKVAAAERTSSGQVQAQVQDNAAAASAADKLTLSKGATKNQHAAEEKLAQAKQASAQAERSDELQRNLNELQKVAAASASPAAAPAPAAAAPAAATTAPGITVPASTAADSPAATPPVTPDAPASGVIPAEAFASASNATPAPAAAEPPAPVAAKPVAPPAPPASEPSFLEGLTGNPLVLPAAGGVLALLLGLVGWRTVQRRRAQAAGNAALSDSQLPPDSFFGSSGGQQVDTRHSAAGTSSTMAYSPSQLDAGGDVDPVAEAEVYLAYGRDVQAEEILKEALRTQPERLGVHMKLAEIYAKRKDAKALEAVVLAVQPLTQSAGSNWEHVMELGRGVDPANPLYQPAGGAVPPASGSSAFADALAKSNAAPVAAAAAAAGHIPAGLDLNLDMDLPGGLADDITTDAAGPASVLAPSDLDFAALEPTWNPDTTAEPSPAPEPTLKNEPAFTPEPPEVLAKPATTPVKPLDLSTLEFSLDEAPAPTPAPASAAADPAFDLSSLDLDLGDPVAPPAAVAVPNDPLATKLDLAREFHAIGDSEGARTLVEEVIAEASGELKTRAQHLLTEID